jgi:hypothetical protein
MPDKLAMPPLPPPSKLHQPNTIHIRNVKMENPGVKQYRKEEMWSRK